MTQHFEFLFFSSRRRHTIFDCDWSSDVCSSDLESVAHDRDLRNQSSATPSGFKTPPGFKKRRARPSKVSVVSHTLGCVGLMLVNTRRRSEERRVGKECRSRWSPYH